MTVVEYLLSKTRFSLEESQVATILIDRNIDGSTDASTLCKEEKELLYADLLMLVASSPKMTGSYSKSHGNYSERWGSEMVDIEGLIKRALVIYAKYNDDNYTFAESMLSAGYTVFYVDEGDTA